MIHANVKGANLHASITRKIGNLAISGDLIGLRRKSLILIKNDL